NDDSIRSIELILRLLADAVIEGKHDAATQQQAKAEGAMPAAKGGKPAANGNAKNTAEGNPADKDADADSDAG
ncbi:MAG: uS2 family ribosomal protein, partial [Planctomycetia bacterium]|nr:uS2 family ribosomal protein [Planctomycetia bacterium]